MSLLAAGASALLMTAGAAVMLPVGAVTLFRARHLYSRMARQLSLGILALHGVTIRVYGPQPFPRSQTIYISNHTSTLDLFVLVALGLPNCRFFLSGFLRKVVPLGVIASMMGTFFTVPQDRPAERTRIFRRAAATLRRTRESVYLSPEGGRVVTGEIGHFNKGSFHLATTLRVPMVPMYLQIPKSMDPGRGYRARPGTVHVHVLEPIDTSTWTEDDLPENTARVRDLYVRLHEEMRCASGTSATAA
jgi:putative phosphoserine phosphatase/1-acylglycerol-3-phosphate O-acyltransferase